MSSLSPPRPVPPSLPPRVPRLPTAAVVLFLLISLTATALGRGERSGWVLMTSPTGPDHRTNSLLGYSYLHDGTPFMRENIPTVTQVAMFSGAKGAPDFAEVREDFRFIRGFYPFAASLITPFVGILPALLIVNWLAWAASAIAAWVLTRDLGGSQVAAFLSVLFVAAGTGMTLHVADLSPHLFAFATYYVGVAAVVRSGVWREPRPLRIHLALGVCLALACLTYNTGVMLTAVYLCAALTARAPATEAGKRSLPAPPRPATRNTLPHVAAATLVALSARPLWQLILGPYVNDLEADYLNEALARWRAILFDAGPWAAAKQVAFFASDFLLFDSPLVVLIGLAAAAFVPMPRKLRLLGWVAVGVPFAAGFVFAPSALARGYLVYAGTIWLYPCLAILLTRALQPSRSAAEDSLSPPHPVPRSPLRPVAYAAVALLLATHLAWSTAHLWHQLGPAKTFFLGWDDGLPYFSAPAEVVSITGREPTPVLFGGRASFAESGALSGPRDHPLDPGDLDFRFAWTCRGFYFAYFVLLTVTLLRRHRAVAAVALLVVAFLSAGLSTLTLRSIPAFLPIDRSVILPPFGTLRYRVEPSADVARALAERAAETDTLAVFVRPYASTDLTLSLAGRTPVEPLLDDLPAGGDFSFRVPSASLPNVSDALRRSGPLTFTLRNSSRRPIPLAGWQRTDLPGRDCVIESPAGLRAAPPALPLVEIRLIAPDGRLKFATF